MTWADRVLCAALLLGSLVLSVGMRGREEGVGFAVVTIDEVEQARLPLTRDFTGNFAGTRGPVEVTVQNGAVAVTRSSCPQHVCVAMGWKRKTSEVLACVPNHLLIVIEGGPVPEDLPDAVAH